MAESFKLIISNLDPLSIGMITLLIVAVLIFLPKAVTEMGIKKLGPIQMEQENQTLNHLTNKQIEAIDIQNRENLWEATEEFIAECAMESKLTCIAVINSFLQAVMSPIRTMVLLNHIAGKLVLEKEPELIRKLSRSVAKSFKDFKYVAFPNSCPVSGELTAVTSEKYETFFPKWIAMAREITVKACFEKIEVYEKALQRTKDKHWKDVFSDCINKNISYIEGMGWIINKQNKLERA